MEHPHDPVLNPSTTPSLGETQVSFFPVYWGNLVVPAFMWMLHPWGNITVQLWGGVREKGGGSQAAGGPVYSPLCLCFLERFSGPKGMGSRG